MKNYPFSFPWKPKCEQPDGVERSGVFAQPWVHITTTDRVRSPPSDPTSLSWHVNVCVVTERFWKRCHESRTSDSGMVREGWGLDPLQSLSNYVKAFVSSLPVSQATLLTDAGLPVSSAEIPAWTWTVSKNVKHHKTSSHIFCCLCCRVSRAVCHSLSTCDITWMHVTHSEVLFPASPPLVCHIDYLSFSTRDWLSWRPWSLRCLCDPKRCSCFSDAYKIFQ